ncbi:FIG024006: iron uptake protein [plant metagenome]|uniref:FIG024006: iron uptake protein n=1 Tax=plant metagenome TaxID=1297885 RepID=A0A484QEW1_9ZZZZ
MKPAAAPSPVSKSRLPARYRWAVASRSAAAVLGGYAFASAAAAALAVGLPLTRIEAVFTANLLIFLFYAAAIIWVFATRSAGRAWVGMFVGTAVCYLAYLVLRGTA